GRPSTCILAGRGILGCDVVPGCAAAAGAVGLATSDEPDAVDEETAAVAREAQARGVPFIAFRAVSDSDRSSDPLGLPGFPLQFYAYYRLAGDNAAAAPAAVVTRWGEGGKLGRAREPRPPAGGTSCAWGRRAARLRRPPARAAAGARDCGPVLPVAGWHGRRCGGGVARLEPRRAPRQGCAPRHRPAMCDRAVGGVARAL